MEVNRFFYRVFLLDPDQRPVRYLGTAFPVAPGGSLLSCRHVVDVRLEPGCRIAVFDEVRHRFIVVEQWLLRHSADVDLAYLPNVFGAEKVDFFPILTPKDLQVGGDVYSFGFFAVGSVQSDIQHGYFAGKIVNFLGAGPTAEMTLPYAVLEGMSGSPVLMYHYGVKLVGVAFGNRASRILAHEVLQVDDNGNRFHESVNRVVEFGRAYHASVIQQFLTDVGAVGFIVSSDRVVIEGLE